MERMGICGENQREHQSYNTSRSEAHTKPSIFKHFISLPALAVPLHGWLSDDERTSERDAASHKKEIYNTTCRLSQGAMQCAETESEKNEGEKSRKDFFFHRRVSVNPHENLLSHLKNYSNDTQHNGSKCTIEVWHDTTRQTRLMS